MVDRDLVVAKVASIDRCLRRIDEVTGGDPASLDAQDAQDIFVLNLQRAAQTAIDLANHLVAANGVGLPQTLKEAFHLLERHVGLDASLSARMQRMVGFRNIAIHAYQALDVAILKAVLTGRLNDLRDFCSFALTQVSDRGSSNDAAL